MSTALLMMDVQNGIVSRFADKPETMATFQSELRQPFIPAFRLFRVAFLTSYPEVTTKNTSFSDISAHYGIIKIAYHNSIFSSRLFITSLILEIMPKARS